MIEAPEAREWFVLIIQGAQPWAGVVQGIEGVKEALTQTLWANSERIPMQDAAAILASLHEPEIWLAHGSGDGRPYWHCWLGYEGGSVTVQRLTKAPQADATTSRLRSALDEIASALSDIAGDLRNLTDPQQRQYVFARRQADQA